MFNQLFLITAIRGIWAWHLEEEGMGTTRRHAAGIIILAMMICALICLGNSPVMAGTKNITLVVGQSKQLRRNAAGWKSTKKRVAVVSESGIVTALKKGRCTLTSYAGKKQYRYAVTVEAPTLSKTLKKVAVDKSFKLKIKGTTKKFAVQSSDPSVASVKKNSKYKYTVTGKKDGKVIISASFKGVVLSCEVIVGTGVKEGENPEDPASPWNTLYLDGNIFKEMTWTVSPIAQQVSNVSRYGQSARLYTHKDGGDGLENIWAAANTGAVGVAGTALSADAAAGTRAKACAWARAVCDSQFHGYDADTQVWMNRFGQAKPNGLGTGDYSCSSLALCAYYFAGVNTLGENLGGSNALYIPNTTKLFYTGYVSYYEGGTLKECLTYNNYTHNILRNCGFVDMISTYNSNRDGFQWQAGDIAIGHDHVQLILTDGSYKDIEVAQAYSPDKDHKGGDQRGNELCVSGLMYRTKFSHVFRFTGAGVRLNTAGL